MDLFTIPQIFPGPTSDPEQKSLRARPFFADQLHVEKFSASAVRTKEHSRDDEPVLRVDHFWDAWILAAVRTNWHEWLRLLFWFLWFFWHCSPIAI
jgi:hypothetical protein